MKMLKHTRSAILAACALFALPGAAAAQTDVYPSRVVKVIVPYAPGGSSDSIARAFTEKLSQALGQQFVIENKGGAAGAIGAEAAAKSPKDGYTLLIAPTATMMVVPTLRKTAYDPIKDFVIAANLGDAFSALAVHPSVPAKTFPEFVEYARKNPGAVNYGTAGIGSIQHLRNERISRIANMGMVHVPYRGSAEAVTDLVAGQVQMMTEIVVLPQVRAGNLRVLAMLDRERNPDFPEIPTLQEAGKDLGFANFEMPSWFALFAPSGTPDAIITKLNDVVVKASADKEMTAQLFKLGYRMTFEKPPALKDMMVRHQKLFAGLIAEIGLKQE